MDIEDVLGRVLDVLLLVSFDPVVVTRRDVAENAEDLNRLPRLPQ